MQPQDDTTPSVTTRLLRLLLDPTSRVSLLVLLSYAAAVLGILVGVFGGGFEQPETTAAAAGIALLGLSFVLMFYVSVTLASLDGR